MTRDKGGGGGCRLAPENQSMKETIEIPIAEHKIGDRVNVLDKLGVRYRNVLVVGVYLDTDTGEYRYQVKAYGDNKGPALFFSAHEVSGVNF